jgi:hypothetical protein
MKCIAANNLVWKKGNSIPMEVLSRFAELDTKLNDFSASVRAQALANLVRLAERGDISMVSETELINMHCHTFYSFNAYGYSPTALAWLAKRSGFKALGIVDFNVLDGVEEYLNACEAIGVRGSAGLETRVYIPEFSTREINSPGEPGVCYHMGLGFTSGKTPAAVTPILVDMRHSSDKRGREIVERLNRHLAQVKIDYDRDVLPLTPGGNATERHILVAFIEAAARCFPDPTLFWAEKLGLSVEKVAHQIGDEPKFQNLVRAKLMKGGGVGYIQPGPDTFPSLEDFNHMVMACGALPCAAWLDGTSAGEQAIEELLDLLISKGVVAFNIIPDRNWNISDPDVRRVKVQNLYRVVELAQRLDLPLNIGTEMNSYGQKLADDFDAPELVPLSTPFLAGAYFIYGHTIMQRALGLGYQSDWANAYLLTRRERNDFYTQVGRLIPPGRAGTSLLNQLTSTLSPAEMLRRLTYSP